MYPGAYDPATPAVVTADGGRTLTYGHLEENSLRLADHLRAAGLRRGDHLALLSDNHPRVMEVYWAALRSGLYLTAVNHHLTADEAAYIVRDCGADALVYSGSLSELAAGVQEVAPVAERLCFDDGTYDAALAAASAKPPAHQPLGADMLYSSGTTGRPKGIEPKLPDGDVREQPTAYTPLFKAMYGFDEQTVYLCPAPLYHAAPLRFSGTVTATGGTVVLMDSFDAEGALAAIERHRVTHSQWVPTMFVRMLKLPDAVRARHDLASLRVAIHAAAPCAVEVKQRMMEWWGPILYEYYSSTEGNGITFIGPDEWLRKPGSVGRAGLLGELHVCDEDGKELAVGETGTVYFEREELPFRYHGDEDRTRQAQHPDHPNWTTTGDIGHVDEDGYLFLTDRRAFTIISGGVNVYPQEAEDCLVLHPAVADVAVIGVPDPELGEAVKAVVRVEDGVAAGPELGRELIAFVRGRIAHYKAPRSVDFAAELPRTPTGKLAKSALRRAYWKDRR
ncbi:acyl-CoA synthetase [Actinomycetota bacterium Odt1-20B]